MYSTWSERKKDICIQNRVRDREEEVYLIWSGRKRDICIQHRVRERRIYVCNIYVSIIQ